MAITNRIPSPKRSRGLSVQSRSSAESSKRQTQNESATITSRSYDEWPVSTTLLLRQWNETPRAALAKEISRFLDTAPKFDGLVYFPFILYIRETIAILLENRHPDAATLTEKFEAWTRNIMADNWVEDVDSVTNPIPKAVIELGFLEEWWTWATTFLTSTYHLLTSQPEMHPVTLQQSRYWWFQGVEASRRNYYTACQREDLIYSEEHQTEFHDKIRDANVPRGGTYSGRPMEPTRSRLDSDDMGAQETESSEFSQARDNSATHEAAVSALYESLDRAFRSWTRTRSLRQAHWEQPFTDPAIHTETTLIEWGSAYQSNIRLFITDTYTELNKRNYETRNLAQIEFYFGKIATIIRRIRCLNEYLMLNSAMLANFEKTVQAYLLEFRATQYPKASEISRIWYMLWVALEEMSQGETAIQQRNSHDMPHRDFDTNFISKWKSDLDKAHNNPLHHFDTMHIVVARYCDAVVEAAQTTFRDLGREYETKDVAENVAINLSAEPSEIYDEDQIQTFEAEHHHLHQLAIRLKYLCQKEQIPLTVFPTDEDTQLCKAILERAKNRLAVPEDTTQSTPRSVRSVNQVITNASFLPSVSSSPTKVFSSPAGVPATPISRTSAQMPEDTEREPRPQEPEDLERQFRSQENRKQPERPEKAAKHRGSRKKSFKARYFRFVPGDGQYLMGETAAVSKAIGEQIARDLSEPGLNSSTEAIEVSCKVQPPFQLPGIDVPGLYDTHKSSHRRELTKRTLLTRARSFFGNFSFGRRKANPTTYQSPGRRRFPCAPEFRQLRRVRRPQTRAFRPVRLGVQLERARTNYLYKKIDERVQQRELERREAAAAEREKSVRLGASTSSSSSSRRRRAT